MIDSNANLAIYVTTIDYTVPTKEYAKKYNIELINGYQLVEKISKINSRQRNYKYIN